MRLLDQSKICLRHRINSLVIINESVKYVNSKSINSDVENYDNEFTKSTLRKIEIYEKIINKIEAISNKDPCEGDLKNSEMGKEIESECPVIIYLLEENGLIHKNLKLRTLQRLYIEIEILQK